MHRNFSRSFGFNPYNDVQCSESERYTSKTTFTLRFESKFVFQEIIPIKKNYSNLNFLEFAPPNLHLAVVTTDSKLISYEIFGEGQLKFSWEMNLPKSLAYSIFTDQSKIYVIPEDGKKDITYVKSSGFHRTISKSQFPIKIGAGVVRWCKTARAEYMIFFTCVNSYSQYTGPFVWVVNKKKWIDGSQILNHLNVSFWTPYLEYNPDSSYWLHYYINKQLSGGMTQGLQVIDY